MEEDEDNKEKRELRENKFIENKSCKSIKKIILASKSARRKNILNILKIDFDVIEPLDIKEKFFKNPYKTVFYNSCLKAKNIYSRVIINNSNYKETIIIGFDTVVYLRGKYFGKPSDVNQARFFLETLSGKAHYVITGICIIEAISGKILTDSDKTVVKFKKLEPKEIENYLNLEYVMDKAGAYDISGFGSVLIEKINGCFYNVAGLPVYKFLKLLKKINYNIL